MRLTDEELTTAARRAFMWRLREIHKGDFPSWAEIAWKLQKERWIAEVREWVGVLAPVLLEHAAKALERHLSPDSADLTHDEIHEESGIKAAAEIVRALKEERP